MSLVSKLATPPQRVSNGNTCSVCGLLNSIDPAEAKALEDAMQLRNTNNVWAWSEPELEQHIADEGFTVGVGAIGKHRRGQCRGNRRPNVTR